MTIAAPYLLFLGDAPLANLAKTAQGLVDWAPERCLAQLRLPGCAADVGLPDLGMAAAAAAGARTLVVGVAPMGGGIADAWVPALLAALEAGLDLAAGLHQKLADHPVIAARAAALGRALHDVRHMRGPVAAATGARRSGRRVLTVGTDCALGKKYTALVLARTLAARGHAVDFRATGQTGILIAGSGIAVDAVVADFIAGAAELLSPAADPAHIDVIEGQGSLFHPAYAGVTLGLVHGSQPDAMVLCHHASRTQLELLPKVPIRPLAEAVTAYEAAARLTNPAARVAAVSLNTVGLDDAAAHRAIAAAAAAAGLPAFDAFRFGGDGLADAVLAVLP